MNSTGTARKMKPEAGRVVPFPSKKLEYPGWRRWHSLGELCQSLVTRWKIEGKAMPVIPKETMDGQGFYRKNERNFVKFLMDSLNMRPIMDFVNFGTKPEEALSAIKGIGERYNSNMGYAARHFVDDRYVRAALYCAAIRFMELGMKEAMSISLGEMETMRSKAADEHVRGWWERQGMPTVPKEMVIRND